MPYKNILDISDRGAFRQWLAANHASESECWVEVRRGRTPPPGKFGYTDAVEEALCFGWIDSVFKRIGGAAMQRFSPRKPKGRWSELNKERCRRLEKLGLMTDAGRAVLPDMRPESFTVDDDIRRAFIQNAKALEFFRQTPPLYQRVRIDTVQRDRRDAAAFAARLSKLIHMSEKGKMFGEWDDGGRLSGR